MLLKQAKIVASISDRRRDVDFIRELFNTGTNVARMDTAHANRKGLEALIANVRAVSNRIAVLMDTRGPEVRTTTNVKPILYQIGEKVKIMGGPERETTHECITVPYPNFVHNLSIGGTILIDDGDLELRIIDKTSKYLFCEVQSEAALGSRKSVNVPRVHINLPSLTKKDRNNILYAIEKDIDFIAHFFVRNRQDVLDIREILDAHSGDIRITAKIENQEGVGNIGETLEVADGVMVVRGDLGVEVPQERIPGIQRTLIRKCTLAKRPVIIATQMLHTIINNPHPTCAEVTDTADIIYCRTDALMLSGETAYGRYPVEVVKAMIKVVAQAEKDRLEENNIRISLNEDSNNVTASPAKQAMEATTKLRIRAIITDSYQGRTACNLAAFRGKYPALATCCREKTVRHLALSYGVEAIYMPEPANGQEYYFATLHRLLKEGRLHPADMMGYPSSGKTGTWTFFLEINIVEDALKHVGDSVLPNSNRYPQDEMKETDLLDGYILKHIDEEGGYLETLYRDTHVKLLCPHMAPGHLQGRMLRMSARMIRPRQISRTGTYSGYSTLCLVEGLEEGGMFYAFEINDEQEDFTHPQLENSIYADKIKFYIGDALQLVPALGVTFGLAFVDSDKRRYIKYYEMTLAHLSPGRYIMADDTLWDGHVLEEPHNNNYRTIGIKASNELVVHDRRVERIIPPLRDRMTIIHKR